MASDLTRSTASRDSWWIAPLVGRVTRLGLLQMVLLLPLAVLPLTTDPGRDTGLVLSLLSLGIVITGGLLGGRLRRRTVTAPPRSR